MGLERRIPSNDVLEIFVENLLSCVFPHAYLNYEPKKLYAIGKATKPDFVFAWPNKDREVFLEITKSPLLPGNDRKRRQKGILQAYVAKHREYSALVMYVQNFGSVDTISQSLMILECLAKEQTNTLAAQDQMNSVALNSGLPVFLHANTLNWESIYDSAIRQIKPRN